MTSSTNGNAGIYTTSPANLDDVKAAASAASSATEIRAGNTVIALVIANNADAMNEIIAAANSAPELIKETRHLTIQLEHARREADALGSACDKLRLNSREILAETLNQNAALTDELYRLKGDAINTAGKVPEKAENCETALLWDNEKFGFVGPAGYTQDAGEASVCWSDVAKEIVAANSSKFTAIPFKAK